MFQLEDAHCQLAETRLQLEKTKVDSNELKRSLVLFHQLSGLYPSTWWAQLALCEK